MRYSGLLLFLGMIVFIACESQVLNGVDEFPLMNVEMTPADTTSLDAEMLRQCRRDAGTMAGQYVNERDSTAIRIPDKIVDTFYHGLLHIYNSSAEDARLVTHTYSIHSRQFGMAFDLTFSYDSSASWGKAWSEGNRLTGNEAIDELILEYDLTFERFYDFGAWGEHTVRFTSSKPLNMPALARVFKQQTEIDEAYASSFLVGGGSNLSANVSYRGIEYIFTLGWGDCPAGCINYHSWKFRVASNGGVTLADEYGNSLDSYRVGR